MPTIKDEVTAKLVEVIRLQFEEKGFTLRRKCFFEREDSHGNLFRYEINISRLKGYNSLHLRLSVLKKPLLKKANVILEKALRDESCVYPANWGEKDIEYSIKGRTRNYAISGLTDWRILKNEDESLEDFNARFSIWICNFNDIDEEKKDWREQLLVSIELADKWFNNVSMMGNDAIIARTSYPSLYLLKEEKRFDELENRYLELLERATEDEKRKSRTIDMSPEELRLYYKYLMM